MKISSMGMARLRTWRSTPVTLRWFSERCVSRSRTSDSLDSAKPLQRKYSLSEGTLVTQRVDVICSKSAACKRGGASIGDGLSVDASAHIFHDYETRDNYFLGSWIEWQSRKRCACGRSAHRTPYSTEMWANNCISRATGSNRKLENPVPSD